MELTSPTTTTTCGSIRSSSGSKASMIRAVCAAWLSRADAELHVRRGEVEIVEEDRERRRRSAGSCAGARTRGPARSAAASIGAALTKFGLVPTTKKEVAHVLDPRSAGGVPTPRETAGPLAEGRRRGRARLSHAGKTAAQERRSLGVGWRQRGRSAGVGELEAASIAAASSAAGVPAASEPVVERAQELGRRAGRRADDRASRRRALRR